MPRFGKDVEPVASDATGEDTLARLSVNPEERMCFAPSMSIIRTMEMTRPVRIGVIGGSGLGQALGAEADVSAERTEFPDTPFGKPSGPISLLSWHGLEIAVLQRHGNGHVLNPSQVPYRANIFAMKLLGVTHIVASGATGSLREEVHPGDLLIPDQVIDRTFLRPRTFYDGAAVHVEFAEPFCPVMRRWLLSSAERFKRTEVGTGVKVHDGATYVCMEGPSFSTRAESNMHRQLGGTLIGMTAMPEARLAREAEIAYALVALPTDYDCWRPHDPDKAAQQLLEEIIANLHLATKRSIALIKTALEDIAILQQNASPAHDALRLAVWSDKAKIEPEEVRKLLPLWGRYWD